MSLMRAAVQAALGHITFTRASDGTLVSATCTATFPKESLVFAGHFPGQPVLPAVLAILLAQCVLDKGQVCAEEFQDIRDAKFLVPIGPDTPIALVCTRDSTRWSCTLSVGSTLAARIRFAARPDRGCSYGGRS